MPVNFSDISSSNISIGDITQNVTTIIEALSPTEEAQKARSNSEKRLAKGVRDYVQKIRDQLEDKEPGGSPYKRLDAYGLEDSELFFGREQAINDLLPLINSHRLTVLHSESGAGKSSLMQAGIAPRLIIQGHLPVYLRSVNNAPPDLMIKRAFVSDLVSTINLEGISLRNFLQYVTAVLPRKIKLYLLLDQFEEIYTLLKKTERAGFLRELGVCLNESTLSRVRWILAVRSEFFSNISDLRYHQIENPCTNNYRLNRLNQSEAKKVIVNPTALQGITFESTLVKILLSELRDEKDELAPPQIQLVCSALYDDLAKQQSKLPGQSLVITKEMYKARGRAEGILRGYLGGVLDQFKSKEQSELAWKVLRALVSSQSYRITYTCNQLAEILGEDHIKLARLLEMLVKERLLTVKKDEQTKEISYELIHDYLLTQIIISPEEQAFKAAYELLKQEVQNYKQHKTLLDKKKYDIINSQREFLHFDATATELLRLSQEVLEQEAAKLRKRALIATGFGIIALTAAIIAVIFGIQSRQNANRAEQEARKSTSRELTMASSSNFDKDLNLSLWLATYAVTEDPNKEAKDTLRRTVRASYLQFTHSGSGNPIYDVAFSPDETYLATAGDDGFVKIWDTSTKKEMFSLPHPNKVYAVAFNPEGTALATACGDGTVRVWNISSHQQKIFSESHRDSVLDITFSPDGSRLATSSQDKTVKIWDVISAQPLLTLTHVTQSRSVDFSPDGAYVATAWDDGTTIIWDVHSGDKKRTLAGHDKPINDVKFSLDGKRLATVSDDSTASIWDMTSLPHLTVREGGGDSINSSSVWDTTSQYYLKTFTDTSPIYGVNFKYPTGKYLISSNRNGEVKIWDIELGEELRKFVEVDPVDLTDPNWAYRVDFSPIGTRIAVAGRDGRVRVWFLFGGDVLALSGHTDRVRDVAFSPDGQRLATASWDGTGKVWDAKSGKLLLTLKGHAGRIVEIVYNPDGTHLATASDDGTARVWDAITGTQSLLILKHSAYQVHSIAFSPDGTMIATGDVSGIVKIWDAVSGENSHTFDVFQVNRTHHNEVSLQRIAFSPDGQRLATAHSDGIVNVWRIATWTLEMTLTGHTQGVDGVVFSPNGQLLATAGWDYTARLWDAVSGKELPQPLPTFRAKRLRDAIFSPDGVQLATSSEGTPPELNGIKIWDVKLWNIISREEILSLLGHLDIVNELAFSPDGKRLATSGADGTALIHFLDIDELLHLAQTRPQRPLTLQECKEYLHQEPCPP